MEVEEEPSAKLFTHHPVEPEVKLEPPEDMKDLADDVHAAANGDGHVNVVDHVVPSSTPMWSFLVKRSRYLYQVQHRQQQLIENPTQLTKTLLNEVELLLESVSEFVRSCCDYNANPDPEDQESIGLNDHLALGLMLQDYKGAKLRLMHDDNLPSNHKEELFASFKGTTEDADLKNEIDLDSIPLPSFSSLPPLSTFNDHSDDDDDDDDDDDLDASFDNNSNSGDGTSSNKFAQYPRPKIVPVDYNKKKQVCVCEQCGGSWSRKEYYYHHKVCTYAQWDILAIFDA